MSIEDRVRWDKIYREREGMAFPSPDPFLFDFTLPVDPKKELRALDLAGGLGQNGLWLATQGYIVDVMEISRGALVQAHEEMTQRKLRNVNLLQVDLDDVDLQDETYALVCVFRYLKRDLFPLIRAAIIPGGRVIYQTFNERYLELVPEFNREFLLDIGELREIFADWELLHFEEETHITQLVAQKPDNPW